MDKPQGYVRLYVADEPRAKPRPRVVRGGGDTVRTYQPVSSVRSEWIIRQVIQSQFQNPLDGPIVLKVVVYVTPPKSIPKKMVGFAYPTKRPDLDNYLKTVMDACNKYAWKDDSQVIRIVAEKRYAWTGSPGWDIAILPVALGMAGDRGIQERESGTGRSVHSPERKRVLRFVGESR